MKKPKLGNKIPYIDYDCQIGERVQWKNMRGESFEGVIISWNDDDVVLSANVKFDDDSIVVIPC